MAQEFEYELGDNPAAPKRDKCNYSQKVYEDRI